MPFQQKRGIAAQNLLAALSERANFRYEVAHRLAAADFLRVVGSKYAASVLVSKFVRMFYLFNSLAVAAALGRSGELRISGYRDPIQLNRIMVKAWPAAVPLGRRPCARRRTHP